ncbi:MAG: hypothetical protein MUE56_00205 [Ignavibacteria bacterium]|jgi:hypothetical protein|nr:hypothetical protein [Ignavibacteria bacterium]
MDKYWDKIRQEKYDGSFDRVSKSLLEKNSTKEKRSKLVMKQFILTHKYKIVFAVVLAFVFAACNYPVTQEKTVGYAMQWSAEKQDEAAVNDALNNLSWLKNANLNVNENNNNGKVVLEFSTVLQGIDVNAVLKYKSDLEKISAVKSVKIVPLTESITRPVYSAALYSFFRVDISSKGKSDEEVRAEIEKQLRDNGFNNANVFYENAGEHKRLMVKIPDDGSMKGKSMEVRVDGDGKEEVVKMKTMKGSGIDASMSDEDIKRKIIEENGLEVKPEDIKITRENGKIKVEVEKEDRK